MHLGSIVIVALLKSMLSRKTEIQGENQAISDLLAFEAKGIREENYNEGNE